MAIKAQATITLSRVDDGSDGIGVKSTDITYQAASSQTSAPTGDWLSKVPELTPKTPYLWTRTVITYTDGRTSTSYSVSSTIDGVVVGGRNLQKNTDFKKKFLHWQAGTGYSIDSINQYEQRNTIKYNISGENTDKEHVLITGNNDKEVIPFESESDVTLSAYFYTDDISKIDGHKSLLKISFYDIDGRVLDEVREEIPFINGKWIRHIITRKSPENTSGINFSIIAYRNGVFSMALPKIEKGNKATDWTPAPEDTEQDIQDAGNKADKAENDASNALQQNSEIKASIGLLEDSLSMMVTDKNGQSLMTQHGNGWTFDMGAFQTILDEATNDITNIKGDVDEVNKIADKTSQLANDIAAKTAYINMSMDETGAPCIELGKSDNEFKLRITNTSIDFMQGSQKIAYITNQSLYIQSSVVTDEMQIGEGTGFIWKKRSNGNMGLRYIG